ncbi:MAG: TIGR02147 family protein [Chitinispirillaceae bacterium]
MNRISIFDYLNYRDYLRDAFAQLKKEDASYTYRKIASELGMRSIGHITWIIQGKRNLTLRKADRFSQLLGLNRKENSYFRLLVLYTNSKKHSEKRDLFEKIVTAQKSQKRIVTKEQTEYWSKWYYSAMRELVAIHKISDDYKEAARLMVPRISPAEAERALKLLEKLEFIVRDERGYYKRLDRVISMDAEWGTLCVRQHQMDMLDLAKLGLEKIPREDRDISSVTMSLSEERFEQVRNLFQDFRQQLITLARTDPNPERVYQVGLQVFPLSKNPGGTDEE